MTVFNRALCAATLLIAFGLAACGDSEPDQRKAFIKFLTEMNARSGVHILNPTADETKSFGDYAKHYAVIVDFSKDIDVLINRKNEQLIKRIGSPAGGSRTIEQMAARRDDLVAIDKMVEADQATLEKRLAQADADRGALKQPDDLKSIYNVTYAKVVGTPALAMQKSNKALSDMTRASLQIVDYINSHRDKLVVKGSQAQTKDKKILAEFGALLKTHEDVTKRFQDAQREGQKLLQGS